MKREMYNECLFLEGIIPDLYNTFKIMRKRDGKSLRRNYMRLELNKNEPILIKMAKSATSIGEVDLLMRDREVFITQLDEMLGNYLEDSPNYKEIEQHIEFLKTDYKDELENSANRLR